MLKGRCFYGIFKVYLGSFPCRHEPRHDGSIVSDKDSINVCIRGGYINVCMYRYLSSIGYLGTYFKWTCGWC